MSRPRNLKKMEEVELVIARLFASRGYHSTSMRDIARELVMNQSSLYYYVDSKEDILFKIMNDAMDKALGTLEKICISKIPPERKLKEVLGFYTRYYAGDQERETLLVNEIKSLGEDYRSVLIEKQRRYVHLIRSILEDLAKTGRMKQIHPTVATFAFFGMVHYTIKWYRRDGSIGIDGLAESFVEIFTGGILAEDSLKSKKGPGKKNRKEKPDD
jgi:AcrR family transcriptional regulator